MIKYSFKEEVTPSGTKWSQFSGNGGGSVDRLLTEFLTSYSHRDWTRCLIQICDMRQYRLHQIGNYRIEYSHMIDLVYFMKYIKKCDPSVWMFSIEENTALHRYSLTIYTIHGRFAPFLEAVPPGSYLIRDGELHQIDCKDCLYVGGSVTYIVGHTKQPYGGYLPRKQMTVTKLGDGMETLHMTENINPALIGLAVDYLSRFMTGTSKEEAFRISLKGAERIKDEERAASLIKEISGLDDQSIINAVKMTGYDVCFRADPSCYKPIEEFNPDIDTIENVRTMIQRSLHFFRIYGEKVLDGLTFQGGYTDMVTSGDGDFMTADTLWDFKVLRGDITSKHTLQLLIYWRLGLHSIHPEYKNVRYLGVFNPRQNLVYRIAVDNIPDEVIQTVEQLVIGY